MIPDVNDLDFILELNILSSEVSYNMVTFGTLCIGCVVVKYGIRNNARSICF